MTLSASAKVRNRELLIAAFDAAGGRYHRCGMSIDWSTSKSLAWVRVAGDGEARVKHMFTKATPTQLAAELVRCRPAHLTCKDPPLHEVPARRRPLLTLKRSPENERVEGP